MKLLIPSDGSEFCDAAIVDLGRAGLPVAAEALVLSVAEVSAPTGDTPYTAAAAGFVEYPPQGSASGEQVAYARSIAAQAGDRLHCDFPAWKIRTETWVDAPASAIIRMAHGWSPDLIVMGSHGRSGISRLVLGSVSQYVLHNTDCSVRISRHRLHAQSRAIRLVLAFNDSLEAKNALHVMATRNWPANTEVRVICVADELNAPAGESREQRSLEEAIRIAADILEKSGLRATPQIVSGNVDKALVKEAEAWEADCIFIGAKRHGAVERALHGSVSYAVASLARCSVEIVRPAGD